MTKQFLNGEFGEQVFPEIKHIEHSDVGVKLTLFVPKNLRYFSGHFPDSPILPGVVQLHWAVMLAKQQFNLLNMDVLDLEVLKFQVVIVPDSELVLSLTQKANNKIVFEFSSDKGQHSSGRIVLKAQV